MKRMLMVAICLLAFVAIGFPLNPSFTPEAVKEYKARADAGDAEAQYLYSFALANGQGVAEDLPLAFVYAKKAADQGYNRALRRVGNGYANGWGVETNAAKAAECYSKFVSWATKAAEGGDANAQRYLGLCYEYGEGVSKDMKEAVKWYRKAAEQGEANAQCGLGWCYRNGDGVVKDMSEAVKWYRKAAEQGDANVQCYLGLCYKYGEGVSKDMKEAAKWYRKAAEQGNANAQRYLGLCYKHGEGVSKDLVEAAKWYRKAAEQGDANAQCNLGWCYEHGEGVSKDLVEAAKWYHKAAEQGDARGQFCLGWCYVNGEGVAKDGTEAMKWFRKAAAQGFARSRMVTIACAEIGIYLIPILLMLWWKRRCLDSIKASWLESWRRCFDFSGRSSRREYGLTMYAFSFVVLAFGVLIPLSVVFLHGYYWFYFANWVDNNYAIFLIFVVWFAGCIGLPNWALGIRRFHDVGKSGWCELLWLVPIWGWIQIFRLLLREGDPEKNKYGDPPPKSNISQ